MNKKERSENRHKKTVLSFSFLIFMLFIFLLYFFCFCLFNPAYSVPSATLF